MCTAIFWENIADGGRSRNIMSFIGLRISGKILKYLYKPLIFTFPDFSQVLNQQKLFKTRIYIKFSQSTFNMIFIGLMDKF